MHLSLIFLLLLSVNSGNADILLPIMLLALLFNSLCRLMITKDNLTKYNWQDGTFECHFARAVWSIIQAASRLSQTHNMSNMNLAMGS